MSRGIAAKLTPLFEISNTRKQMIAQRAQRLGTVVVYTDPRTNRKLFNLMTKTLHHGKPKMKDLVSAIHALKVQCEIHGVDEIHIPKIGCGLDKLDWEEVLPCIEEAFTSSKVKVYIHLLEKAPSQPDSVSPPSPSLEYGDDFVPDDKEEKDGNQSIPESSNREVTDEDELDKKTKEAFDRLKNLSSLVGALDSTKTETKSEEQIKAEEKTEFKQRMRQEIQQFLQRQRQEQMQFAEQMMLQIDNL
jgi:hypothetical protein